MAEEIQVTHSKNGERAISATICGGVNPLKHALSSGQVKAEGVLKAAATAYATAGANLATTMAVNVGAEGMVSWVKNDTANEAMGNMLLSAAGTAVEFKAGEFGKNQADKIWNSYSAAMKSKPTGFLTIEGPYARSAWPSIAGNIGGSVGAELPAFIAQMSQEMRGK